MAEGYLGNQSHINEFEIIWNLKHWEISRCNPMNEVGCLKVIPLKFSTEI
jgi:hypothetical protein